MTEVVNLTEQTVTRITIRTDSNTASFSSANFIIAMITGASRATRKKSASATIAQLLRLDWNGHCPIHVSKIFFIF